MNHCTWLFAILLSLSFVPDVGADEGDKRHLQGTWVAESAAVGGKPTDRFKGATLTFNGDLAVMRSKFSSGRVDVDENPYEIEEDVAPKRIALFQKNDRDTGVQRGIYELDGDRLKVCISGPGAKEYPADFATEKCLLLILKRQK